jgi:hypothetical protein
MDAMFHVCMHGCIIPMESELSNSIGTRPDASSVYREGSGRWLDDLRRRRLDQKQEGASIVACIEGIERRPRIRGGQRRFPYLHHGFVGYRQNRSRGSPGKHCGGRRTLRRGPAILEATEQGRQAGLLLPVHGGRGWPSCVSSRSGTTDTGTKITPKSGDHDYFHTAQPAPWRPPTRTEEEEYPKNTNQYFGERNLPRISE